jgi:2-C-methyl-D-erythritol 2,4-cyclodiphosphate synthase
VNQRVGLGYDIHPYADVGTLVLGGVDIAGTPALGGHSDGDALAHAVADAICGPTGLPDLGTQFPATDERWRGARSVDLLRTVATTVAGEGWWVVNVDAIVSAERPALAPHLAAMCANLVSALEPAREPMGEGIHVSVKPKRGEGIGAVGRGEAVAVWAVALVLRA